MAVPKARKSSNNETQIRVPRTHGLPKQTLGSTEILLKSGFTAPDPFELQDTSLENRRGALDAVEEPLIGFHRGRVGPKAPEQGVWQTERDILVAGFAHRF